MEARRRSINFGFPGYDGSLPRAVRSLRGRGEGLRKSKDSSKGMGFFDLLVTVAGQILQDGDECEEKKVNFSADHEMAKNKTVDTKEKVSADEQSEMLSEDQIGALLNELHRGGSMLASKVENGRTGQESNLDRREFVNDGKFEHDVIDSCQVEAVKALLSPYGKHSQEPFTISNQEDGDASILHMDDCGASSLKCMGLQTSSVKGQESLSITHEDQLLPACGAYLEDVSSRKVEVGKRQRLEGFENCGEDGVMSDLNPLTVEVASGKLACSFIDFREGKGESENDYGSFRRWTTTEEGVRLIEHDGLTFDDEKPPLVSSGSSGEAPMCMEGNSSEIYFNISSERQAGRRRKVSRESNARDNDDNSSESAVPKTVPKKPIKKMSYLKALKSRRLENDTTRNRFPGPGSKRKHAELEGKVASFASCPTSPIANPSSKMSGKKSAEPHVKLSIKSFTVPELSVDLPESATVANLKRAVMEAAMNLLGGGLRVRVLLQGKKVPDESASLVQVGISRTGKLDSLGFMLEPSPIPTSPTGTEDQILVLSCAANQSASRYSAFSIGGEVNQNTFKGHNGKVNGAMEANAANNTALGVQADAVNQLKSDLDPPSSASHGPLVPGSGALILHPSLGGEGVQGLALVPVSQKLRNTEIGKRRMRRPFSVAEVEALVHAVEKLGTGRWRDVKLQAFDQAKHRTYVDLKDKWKTLVHTAQIAPHQRRGEPVPQELLDRVTQAHSYWTAQQAKQQADLGL